MPAGHGGYTIEQYKSLLQKYQNQNKQCHNKLYADYMKSVPVHLHPATLIIIGALLGAVVTYVGLRFWKS